MFRIRRIVYRSVTFVFLIPERRKFLSTFLHLRKSLLRSLFVCVSGIQVDIFPSRFGGSWIKLTINEIESKFAHEYDKKHHKVETLLKEQKNMIRELTIEVHQLSKVIKEVFVPTAQPKWITRGHVGINSTK